MIQKSSSPYGEEDGWSLIRIAFVEPWIGVIVVAVALPEAQAVGAHEFEAAQPFGTLPKVFFGSEQAQWEAVVGGELFAVVFVGQQRIVEH